MLTLSLETSAVRGTVALCRDEVVLAERVQGQPNAHAEQMLPLIDEVLAAAGVQRAELQRVAVGLGPGSFTGLRVGIALAQGLAVGLGVEAVGVPSLLTLAAGAPRSADCELYGALIDARRNECFFAAFDAEHQVVVEATVLSQQRLTEQLGASIGGRSCRIVGEAARRYLPPEWTTEDASTDFPEARRVAQLVSLGFGSTTLAPLYLRDADAKLPDLPPNPMH